MKKIIQIVLSLILMFSLTACGDSAMESGVDSNTNNNNQNEVQSENQSHTNGGEVTLEALMNAEPAHEDQFTYSGSEGNSFSIGSYKGTDNMVVIPEEYKNTPITSIGKYAFGHYSHVEAIRLNDNITEIGDVFITNEVLRIVVFGEETKKVGKGAFQLCSSLETVILNEGLQEIGISAFLGCKNLKEITIPDTVTHIGYAAFMSCHEDFTIYGKAGSYAETYAAENNIPFVAK